jgi:hypothetical protein
VAVLSFSKHGGHKVLEISDLSQSAASIPSKFVPFESDTSSIHPLAQSLSVSNASSTTFNLSKVLGTSSVDEKRSSGNLSS